MNQIPAKERAKVMRKAIKAAFPGQKISVRASNFSLGSSVDISYEMGPSYNEVQKAADKVISEQEKKGLSYHNGKSTFVEVHRHTPPAAYEMVKHWIIEEFIQDNKELDINILNRNAHKRLDYTSF